MTFFDLITSWFAPYECLGCGLEGSLLCVVCAQKYVRPVPSRCYRCHKLTKNDTTCKSCRASSSLTAVHVATAYQGVAKQLVQRMKFAHAPSASCQAASSIVANVCARFPASATLVPVPTTTQRSRQRGYDQSVLLARELSRATRLPYQIVLARTGRLHQVGASRQIRLRQLQHAFRIKRPNHLPSCVILVDDVLTTGATLEAAARVLKAAGVKRVEAAVFAQA